MLRFVLLGDPVGHSLSPVLHTAALEACGLAGTYRARQVDADGVAAAVEEIRAGVLDGANVTMPHKRLAAAAADVLTADAARARSVNTLAAEGGEVVGTSTDVEGIRRAWGGLPAGPALILGAGGAAAAALLALEGRPLRVAARVPERAAAVIELTGVEAEVAGWTEGPGGAVVVNATPIGMHGDGLPEHFVAGAGGLFDMPYRSGETPTIAAARAAGLPVVEGLEMLLHQAARSFELWTDRTAPLEAMRAALNTTTRRSRMAKG